MRPLRHILFCLALIGASHTILAQPMISLHYQPDSLCSMSFSEKKMSQRQFRADRRDGFLFLLDSVSSPAAYLCRNSDEDFIFLLKEEQNWKKVVLPQLFDKQNTHYFDLSTVTDLNGDGTPEWTFRWSAYFVYDDLLYGHQSLDGMIILDSRNKRLFKGVLCSTDLNSHSSCSGSSHHSKESSSIRFEPEGQIQMDFEIQSSSFQPSSDRSESHHDKNSVIYVMRGSCLRKQK